VKISAADGRDLYLDQYVSWTKLGDRDVANFGAGFRLRLNDREHCIGHERRATSPP
jgi:hypothetical protein